METQVAEVGGQWWRFTDYVIDDSPVPNGEWSYTSGYIRPSPGARLEKYQLLAYPGAETGEGHQELARDNFQALLDLNVDDNFEVISWCRKYGLLGVLTQATVQLRLAPRWQIVGLSYGAGTRRALSPYQTVYARTPAGWQGMIEPTGWRTMDYEGNEEYDDGLAEPGFGISPTTPTALMTQVFSSTYEEKPLGDAVGRFFPRVPFPEKDTALYPHPLSDEFWHQYCEPLEEFRWTVRGFQTMMDNLSLAGPWCLKPPSEQGAMVSGQDQLNSLLSIYPGLWIDYDGTVNARWSFPSLLSIFAFEVWQKLIGGQSVRHCKRPKCRRLFLSAQYNRDYCSDRCRQAEEKARQRRRTLGR